MDQVLKSLTLDFFGMGKHKVSPEKFLEAENAFLLDVRSKEEIDSISIMMRRHPNVECKNIPVDEIPDRIGEIPQSKTIGVFCSGVSRSAIVYAYLVSKGFKNVRILDGGYSALTEALKPGKLLKSIHSEDKK